MKPNWFPDWSRDVCVIVASGPSASLVDLTQTIGKTKFVVINNSWKLAPWADFLFAADYKWWRACNGCPEFQGWKVTSDRRAAETQEWGLFRIVALLADDRIQTHGSTIGWGGNSGFQALNMVVHFQCSRIILVGFDATIKFGLHWHAPHPGSENPTPSKSLRWQRSMDGAFPVLENIGVRVVNCSEKSSLKKYPKMSFEDALAHFDVDVYPN
jgi:hypothetical protein